VGFYANGWNLALVGLAGSRTIDGGSHHRDWAGTFSGRIRRAGRQVVSPHARGLCPTLATVIGTQGRESFLAALGRLVVVATRSVINLITSGSGVVGRSGDHLYPTNCDLSGS